MILDKRATYCRDAYGRLYRCRSAWNDWARWVVLVVILVFFFLLFILCSCIAARRRRRAGRNPYYGTGWMAGRTPPGHGPATYNPNDNNTTTTTTTYNAQPYYAPPSGHPAPPYSPPPGGYYGGQQQGYTGHTGPIELQNQQPQMPQQSYQPRGGENVYGYEPPSGPPPGKEGAVVR